jgi:hypothetical protein
MTQMTATRQSLKTLLKTIQYAVLPLTDSGVHVYLDVDINGELCIEIMLTKYQIVTGIQLDDTDDLENPQTVIDFSINWFKEQLPRIQKAIAEQKAKCECNS